MHWPPIVTVSVVSPAAWFAAPAENHFFAFRVRRSWPVPLSFRTTCWRPGALLLYLHCVKGARPFGGIAPNTASAMGAESVSSSRTWTGAFVYVAIGTSI